ncbi:MAG: hypothetical protein QOE61_3338 [Micromonosporaceae bacterium]|nr:hypothetical protein [Micromonosporaceae bacterium]
MAPVRRVTTSRHIGMGTTTMRFYRALLGIVGLIAIGGTSACGSLTTAKAANAVQTTGASVEVSPNTAAAGVQIAVRATCADNSNSANFTSTAFGTVAAQPYGTSSALLVAQVVVPTTVAPGTFDVTVTCSSGVTATTKLTVIVASATTAFAPGFPPTIGPNTGGGFTAGRGQNSNGAAPWFAAGAASLALAAAFAGMSLRRRRRTPKQRMSVDR